MNQKATLRKSWGWEEKKAWCGNDWFRFTKSWDGVGWLTPPGPMKMLSWNYRGWGNPQVVRSLLRITHIGNPHLVFLMETRLKKGEVNRLQIGRGFNFGLFVSCVGQEREHFGGLACGMRAKMLQMSLSFSSIFLALSGMRNVVYHGISLVFIGTRRNVIKRKHRSWLKI